MINMLRRYVFGKFVKKYAVHLFAKVLNCVIDLKELNMIKKQRQLAIDLKKLDESDKAAVEMCTTGDKIEDMKLA